MLNPNQCVQSLVTDGCLERWRPPLTPSLSPSAAATPLPVYIMHAKRLGRRRRHIEEQLLAVGVVDATFVLCADADVVARLDPAIYRCLHPQYTLTAWSRPGTKRLGNGTLSLALKHRLAHVDAARRGLAASVMLEDDAVLPGDLWAQLLKYSVPVDADVFFLGSYSRSSNPKLTLANAPTVPGTQPTVHRRVNGTSTPPPHILGTVAYVLYLRGARALCSQPVRAESDVDLSLLVPTAHCARTSPRCAVAAPPIQYGPTQWIVWQDESLGKERTHGAKNSVHDGWARACRTARASDQGLLRACRKFGFVPGGAAVRSVRSLARSPSDAGPKRARAA